MPWKETCAMDQRIQFIRDWLSGDYNEDRAVRSVWDQPSHRG